MNNKKSSIDGFIPRRAGSEIGERHGHSRVINGTKVSAAAATPRRRELRSEADLQSDVHVGQARTNKELGRSDIYASLSQIDEIEPPKKKLSRRERKRLKRDNRTKSQRVRRRIIFSIIWLIVIAAVAALGYLGYKAWSTSDKVLQGNIFGIVQSEPLKEDANGRSNFLIFGTAEDSEGGTHDGGHLTDSIMVISVDQDKKDAYMVSLPRDLWVDMEMPEGEICSVGYQEKLNSQYQCGSDFGKNEEAGANSLRTKVGEITGLDVQYFIHLNFTAVAEAVDAVGGVEITIESEDPRGILDRNFDWRCKYECYYVNYKNGETVHMDGDRALAFARARNAAGGYGVGDNFGREKNQQKVIKALREKAVSAGTLTNLGAVTGLIDALGNNLRTNIDTKEIRTLMDLGVKIPSDSILSVSLMKEGEEQLKYGRFGAASIVEPIIGLKDYSGIRNYIKKEISSEPYVKESSNIVVLNGSGTAGIAQTLADKLEDLGFTIGQVGNAPEGTYQSVEIYQITQDKPATLAKLEALYGVKAKTTTPPASVLGTTDYLIIIGDAAAIQ